MMEPPEGFIWEQHDAMTLRCMDCNEIVKAGVLDLHTC